MRVGVIQMSSTDIKEENINKAEIFIRQAAKNRAKIIALPEHFNFRGSDEGKAANKESIPGPTSKWGQSLAKELNVYLLLGSILEQAGTSKVFNTSLLINPQGQTIGKYRKLHLFDACISGFSPHRESGTIQRGKRLVVAETQFGKVGLSICYDLRFPELYRSLSYLGAKIIFVPAAFTLYTGKDHWAVLLRARAIENQVYVIASAQIGTFNARDTYGRSMIIDPWGTIIAQASDTEGVTYAEIDLNYQKLIQGELPVLEHRRCDLWQFTITGSSGDGKL